MRPGSRGPALQDGSSSFRPAFMASVLPLHTVANNVSLNAVSSRLSVQKCTGIVAVRIAHKHFATTQMLPSLLLLAVRYCKKVVEDSRGFHCPRCLKGSLFPAARVSE